MSAKQFALCLLFAAFVAAISAVLRWIQRMKDQPNYVGME